MIPVSIGCLCPPGADGTPRHEADTVYLRDRLDFRQAVAVRNDARTLARLGDATEGEFLAALAEGYILQGVEAWSLVDAKGKALPASRENIRAILLADYDEAETVANAADNAYSEAVVFPLLGEGVEILGGFADARLDICEDHYWIVAPEAVLAVLDLHYPDGRHRDDIATARWRLQLLGELSVGRLIREDQRQQDAKVKKLKVGVGRSR